MTITEEIQMEYQALVHKGRILFDEILDAQCAMGEIDEQGLINKIEAIRKHQASIRASATTIRTLASTLRTRRGKRGC